MSRGRKPPFQIEMLGQMRADHRVIVTAEYSRAEVATNGVMLNRRGKEAGIDPWMLFRKSGVYMRAYASRELLEWIEQHPHMTFDRYVAALAPEEPF